MFTVTSYRDLFDLCQYEELIPNDLAEAANYEGQGPWTLTEEELNELRDENGQIEQEAVMPYVCDFVVEYINSDMLVCHSSIHDDE